LLDRDAMSALVKSGHRAIVCLANRKQRLQLGNRD